jgi:hypothetical protein
MIALLRSVVAVVVGHVLFAALVFMAPGAVLGGWLRARRERP